jgi:expansin (peptidoglycan-binding protein)
MSLPRGSGLANSRATLALTGVVAALLALTGCVSASGGSAQPTAISAASAPVVATPTRYPVVDALLAATPSTTPPAPSTAPPTSASPSAAAVSQAPPVASSARPAAPVVPVAAGRIRPGVVYTGRATEHEAGQGDGNCLFGPSDSAVQIVAMNETDYDTAAACGDFLEVTGPGGSTVVKVTDRCPECPPGALDLSKQAFARIAGGAQGGLDKVTWRLVSPADIGPLQFQVKKESSQWWVSLQARNHRNPIVSLEIQRDGQWVAIQRQMYNYYESEGFGAGPFTVRVTDLYGQQIVSTVNLTPGAVQTTSTQFAQH